MHHRILLSPPSVRAKLGNSWKLLAPKLENENGLGYVIQKDFVFKDFSSAFEFMTNSAVMCEKMNHHPEWLNVYNRVSVRLSTHGADGVTEMDLKLASFMDEVANKPSHS